jgi:hypothetical protein
MSYPDDFVNAVKTFRTKIEDLETTFLSFIEDGKTFSELGTDLDVIWSQFIVVNEKIDGWQADSSYENLNSELKLWLNDRIFGAIEKLYSGADKFKAAHDYLQTWGSAYGSKTITDMPYPLRNVFKKRFFLSLRRIKAILRRVERTLGRIPS